MRHGRTCGSFWCGEQEIARLTQGDLWFDGTVVSVIAEVLVQGNGTTGKAVHLSPQVLHSIRILLGNPSDASIQARERLSVSKQLSKVWVYLIA